VNFVIANSRWAFLLLLALTAMVAAGCATTESENVSERPWNTPQGWETGLPSGMYNQYR
jgi:hypothetical protein